MAFDAFTQRRLDKVLMEFIEQRRPPAYMRNKLDMGYAISNQSVEIFEIRPAWRHPEEVMRSPVAKTTYVKTQGVWKVYWLRQDLKWHAYEPLPQVNSIEAFLAEVNADPHFCFWG